MITLIRHSEKLKNVNKKKWERSKRFKENIYDTPITSNGKKIAKKAFNKLILQGYDNIDYLYCSPLTRCIQTCLVIKKIIKKKFKKELKIRIEYGLVESNFDSPIKFYNNDKNKCFFDKKSKIKYLDNELSLKNIIKKYGNEIDKSYKSKTKFKDVSFDKNNVYFINTCSTTYINTHTHTYVYNIYFGAILYCLGAPDDSHRVCAIIIQTPIALFLLQLFLPSS